MYTRILRVYSNKVGPYFDPEGMNKAALNYYLSEATDLSSSFTLAKPYTERTEALGYLEEMYSGKNPEISKGSLRFMRKIGIENARFGRLTNSDGKIEIPLLIDERIQIPKYLRSYCKVRGVNILAKNQKKVLLVSEIVASEPRYDFENDWQFSNLGIESTEDILSLFPESSLTYSEEKEKAFLASLVGAQEKQFTKGGIGNSIVSNNLKQAGAERLFKDLNSNWYPIATRGKVSLNASSFISDYEANILSSIPDSEVFLRHKINRNIGYQMVNIKRDLRFMTDFFRYTHVPINLDSELKWPESSNSLDMVLARARAKRVLVTSEQRKEASDIEQALRSEMYDIKRLSRIPESVLDIAETLTKINGKSQVTSELAEARKIVSLLTSESADEIGEITGLSDKAFRDMSEPVRIVYNLIADYGKIRPINEIKEMAIAKGIKERALDAIVKELTDKGEIYQSKIRDGLPFYEVAK